MSHTLLMRLAGPMQSWGLSSRFSERDSGLEPSKSGVVGILAAAMGRPREGDVSDLTALTMGVRADKEGVLSYDFHTAGASKTQPGIIRAQGSGYSTSISRRFHLQDAVFLVGLEGDNLVQLEALDVALREPVFPIGLGRRGHVPSCPVAMVGTAGAGVRRDTPLAEALRQEPWPVADIPRWQQRRLEQAGDGVRLVLEDPAGSITRPDQPVGAAFSTRVFGPRSVVVTWCQPPRRETDRDQ